MIFSVGDRNTVLDGVKVDGMTRSLIKFKQGGSGVRREA